MFRQDQIAEPGTQREAEKREAPELISEDFLIRPAHDTGSIWYTVGQKPYQAEGNQHRPHHQEYPGDQEAPSQVLLVETVVAVFLPILGLVAALLFSKFHHTRNYKACRKGAIIGFICLGVLLAIFLLLLVLTVV